MEDVVVVYREKLGEVGGCAGDYSRGRRGCHYIAGKAKGAGKVWDRPNREYLDGWG